MQAILRTALRCAGLFTVMALLISPLGAAPGQDKAAQDAEPEACILIGGGLIAISFIGRRKRAMDNEA